MQAIDQSKHFSNDKFDDAFVTYLKERPRLRDYIGPLYTQIGCGWTYDIIRCFGLTIRGIERILANSGLAVPVLVSELQLQDFIKKNPSGLAKAIISNEIYVKSDNGKHVYTIAYQKIKGQHLLYVYDAAGSELPMTLLQKCFNGEPFIVYYPTKIRQQPWETNCYAYAIHDLKKIDFYPPPLPEIVDSSYSHSIFASWGLFKSSQVSQGEIQRFDLAPDFFSLDSSQYKKNLFKTVIDLELDSIKPSYQFV